MSEREQDRKIGFGQYLKGSREATNFTQEQLARRVGMDNTSISKIETGKIKPNIPDTLKLADELGLSRLEMMVVSGHLVITNNDPEVVNMLQTVWDLGVFNLR